MNRRIFLTWIGLGFLASTSPIAIAALINQDKHHSVSNSSSKGLKPVLFYVASNGSDRWSGQQKTPNFAKQDGPFATLKRAQDAIGELKRQQGGTLQQPVTVFLRGGTYFLSEPLIFTPENSGTAECPITYRAYREEKPIISGGQPIKGWKKQGNIWVANLPQVKQGQWYFRLLRVRDDWAIRARYPNFDPKHPLTGGWLYVHREQSVVTKEQDLRDRLPVAPVKFPNWQNWEGAEVHVFMKHNYGNAIFPVSNVDRENHTLLGNFVNASYPTDFGNRFLIENVREALNSPDEWYLDIKTGELLYWSTEPDFPKNVDVVAPTISKLIVLQGESQTENFVEHINFQGLTFTDTNYNLGNDYYSLIDAAMWFSTTRQCLVENCDFVRLGGYGIKLEQNSHENRIIHNTMSHLGQAGVLLLGDKATQPFNNSIVANEIHDCGKVYKHVAGIYVTTGSGNYIAHNYIYNMPRYGISLKSFDSDRYSHNNTVEFNEIIDTNLETNDTGAIETLGRDRQASGNIIRFNFIRNVVGMGTTKEGKILSPYNTWGIYLDDYSSNTIVYGNIVVGTVLGAIRINGGKDNLVDNNIFVDGAKNQIQLSPKEDLMTGNLIYRNIIISQQPEAKLWDSTTKWQPNILKNSDFNLYWHTGGLNIEKTKQAITPEGNFKQWQAAGFDTHSLVTEPPFLTPLKQDNNQICKEDFKLDRHSDVFKQLGLKPIPIERIGIQGFQL